MECRVSEPKSEFLSLLTSQGRRAFDHDIESLATDRIVHHFPWDAAGRPALKSIVLLAAYDTVMCALQGPRSLPSGGRT